MEYRCVDRGSLRCPCTLMEAGQCYTCTMSREGKCDCSESWQGVCPYNEFLQRGCEPVLKDGLPEEIAAEVLKIRKYSEQLAVVRLAVSRGFAWRCSCPGSFITASSLGCRTPLSVLSTGFDTGKKGGFVETAVQPAGPKTGKLLDAEPGDKWKIAGPFEAGLFNRERIRVGEPLTVIAKGTAIAPFINMRENMRESFQQGAQAKLLVDDDKLTEDFLADYLADCSWEKVSLAEDEDKILAAIDEAIQVMLLTSPYYTERFLGMRPERKNDIITANHANMCCGAGICGACSYTDKDGVTVRRCRCID